MSLKEILKSHFVDHNWYYDEYFKTILYSSIGFFIITLASIVLVLGKIFNYSLSDLTGLAQAIGVFIVFLELLDKFFYSKPSVKTGLYMPIKNDKLQVNYRDDKQKKQNESSGKLTNTIKFKLNEIRNEKETICFAIRNHGRKLNDLSCYISFQPDDEEKLRFSKHGGEWDDNPNKTVWINPKNDAYVFYNMAIPHEESLVIPLKANIPKSVGKYNIRFEVNSSTTACPLVKENFWIEVTN